jgi:hypothetical protein
LGPERALWIKKPVAHHEECDSGYEVGATVRGSGGNGFSWRSLRYARHVETARDSLESCRDRPQLRTRSHAGFLGQFGRGDRLFGPQVFGDRERPDIRVAGEGSWDRQKRQRLIRAKTPELVALGAVMVPEEHHEERFGHVVMLDPEGNEFCIA